jgi:large subunit ribosomal protein L4
MKAKVLTLDSGDAGEIDLKDEIFGLEPRADLIQRVVVWQLAKRRAGTHKTKTRGEVNRTTKKVYRQKGTGSAVTARDRRRLCRRRQGHGAGGAQPRIRSAEKGARGGLAHALSAKARDSKLIVLDAALGRRGQDQGLAKRWASSGGPYADRRRRVRENFQIVGAQSRQGSLLRPTA